MPSTMGWIWPRDPKLTKQSRWPRGRRFLDVLRNKGPDIFIGTIHSSNDENLRHWSGWEHRSGSRRAKDIPALPGWGRARKSEEKYDFRTRRYQVPDKGTWSAVRYCDCGKPRSGGGGKRHIIPLQYWDKDGNPYPSDIHHDLFYGPPEDWNERWRRYRTEMAQLSFLSDTEIRGMQVSHAHR